MSAAARDRARARGVAPATYAPAYASHFTPNAGVSSALPNGGPDGPGARRGAAARLEVYKFGGAALADADAVRRAVALVAARRGAPVVVVASAVAGVTDALVALADAAPALADERLDVEAARLRAVHHALAGALLEGEAARDAAADVDRAVDDVAALVRAARVIGHVPASARDRLLAHGEQLSAGLLARALAAAGAPAAFVPAERCVATDGRHGDASPDPARTRPAARRALGPLLRAGVAPVVPGFLGAAPNGDVVTLGRGGSDLTATLLARALGARAAVLWKEVPGLLTADPRVVPGARRIPSLDAREAAELAHHGARVLHPRAVAALGGRTRLVVRAFGAAPRGREAPPGEALGDPLGDAAAGAGSVVRARPAAGAPPVRAVAATMDQALVSVAGDGLRARPGLLARALAAVEAAGVGVALVAQGASAYALTLAVAARDAAAAADALAAALAPELARGELRGPAVRPGAATVGVVGTGVADDPRVPARAFAALADAGVGVLATAFGASSVGLSVVVDATRAAEAQRALHDAFELHREPPRATPRAGARRGATTSTSAGPGLVLLGAGAIGRALLGQVTDARRGLGPGAALRVCAVADSAAHVADARGLPRRTLAAVAAHKAAGHSLGTFPGARPGGGDACVRALAAERDPALGRPTLVDVTAADTTAAVEQALAAGWDVVLANKLPLAGPQAAADRLREVAAARGRHLLHEATVGAGLPVLDTLRKLQEAGDRVLAIEGCPSGTLGYLFAELGRGRAFSEAVRAAAAAGYTEPDPRADLSGADVARKAVILARRLGWRGELADVPTESLVPPALADVPRAEFLTRLGEADAAWEARVAAARGRGRVLRYRIRVTPRRVDVGLVEVAPSDPLGGLTGTDNQFAFTTARYRRQPLVVTGPGAGAEVTAAGVFGDLLRVAAERIGGWA